MRKLNFNFIGGYKEELIELSRKNVVFIRPIGSALYRVFFAPTYRVDEVGNTHSIDNTELVQVLNTICTRFLNGVWYFRFTDDAVREEIAGIFIEMECPHLFVEPDEPDEKDLTNQINICNN